MSSKDIHTSYFELQKTLKLILEIPERLNRIDNVTKKELLIHIKERKYDFFKIKNELLIHNPGMKNYDFENNLSQVFTFNELNYLNELILQSIEKTVKRNDFEKHFNNHGLKLFDYLNEEFKNEKAPTTKYTILFHFLNNNSFILCTRVEYLKFVKEYCDLKIKFSRLDFLEYTNEKYIKYEQELIRLYNVFLKLNTIE